MNEPGPLPPKLRKLAIEADLIPSLDEWTYSAALKRFVALVRADERESIIGVPMAWLCEFNQADGTTRTSFCTEDPAGLRFNDEGEPSPFKTTALYAILKVGA